MDRDFISPLISIIALIVAILIFIVALVGHHHLLAFFGLVLIILQAVKIYFNYKKNIQNQDNRRY
ncbi:hypothetical protein N9R04_08015 [Staphylococcus sp. SQ8-PEA]|uniref:Uncharacterized protein n=1 Tax=Staphylococcus marylandisciuri TaxID=2981529 RepID=A0ABT2QRQ2_9STAP|nr:hypothetical protein [Staphylococcus marylandisciuri]MCU5746653.1 hypothetical protein [Staphylococcus marylandisciuri]